MGENSKKVERNKEMAERVDALFRFLGVIFTDNEMDEVEIKEALYLIKYIRSTLDKCLEGQQMKMIPIFDLSLWASADGKMGIIVDPSPNIEIQQGHKQFERQ